ncbi:MAG: hypothetical protein OCC46_14660 [Pseudodesulfovibrio sp.]
MTPSDIESIFSPIGQASANAVSNINVVNKMAENTDIKLNTMQEANADTVSTKGEVQGQAIEKVAMEMKTGSILSQKG